MIKISIIIPCYNMEKFLPNCLNSIVNQTLQEIEIIVIDDGSTDGTPGILENYRKKNNSIKCLKSNHVGSGGARNIGIDNSNGEYIAFMDADDYYPHPNALFFMYNAAKKNKALLCGGRWVIDVDGELRTDSFFSDQIFTSEGWYDYKTISKVFGYLRFIYLREYLIENRISFPNYSRHQDPPFFVKALYFAKNVYYLDTITYVYRKEHKKMFYNTEILLDCLKAEREVAALLQKYNMSNALDYYIDNIIHGETAGIAYKYYYEGCNEIGVIIHEINLLIKQSNKGKLLLEGDEIVSFVGSTFKDKIVLLDELKKDKVHSLIVFGAGKNAKKMVEFLEKESISPTALVVSDASENSAFCNAIPVTSLTNYIDCADKFNIIIAISNLYLKDVKESVSKYPFNKVYYVNLETFFAFFNNCYH